MATKPSFLITFIVMLMMASSIVITARPLMKPTMENASSPSTSITYRLKLDEETGYCWDSLMQLQHCSGELIMFFLNGETFIGPGCCSAIRTVKLKCWPTMIGVLGFTAQEGDMLQGYCDDHDGDNNGDNDHHVLASSPLSLSVKFKPTTVVRSFNP